MKKFSVYQYLPGQPMTSRDKREVNSKFWNKGKWDNFVAPLLPEDCSDMTLVDMGCNAGLFLQLAEKKGFRNAIGVDSDKEAVRRAIEYRDRIGGRYDVQRRKMERSVDRLPISDYTILVNAHYYFEINDFLDYVDRLQSKTRYCIIVTGAKRTLKSIAAADSNSIRDYFKTWDEVKGIDEIPSYGDPAPRRLWTLCFKSKLIERIDINKLDNGNHQQIGFYGQLDKDGLNFDARKTDYYRRMKTYRMKEHRWSLKKVDDFVWGKAYLYMDIKKSGLMKPIIVSSKNNRIVDGNHRCEMLKHLGYKSILIRRVR